MKFSSYNPVVNPSVMRNVPVEASRDLNVYGGRSGGEMWKALGNVAKMGLALQKDVVDGKMLEANAEYNRRMSEGTAELMQRKEGAALNITEDYDDLQKKVYADIQEKYGGYLFGEAANTFKAYTAKDDATRRAGVVRYQAGQTEAFAETQYNNQLAECRATALENGGTIENVAAGLNRMDAIVEGRYGSYGGEKVIEQKRLAAGKIVGDAVSMAIDSGDFIKAETLVNTYKDLLPTNAYIEARSKIQKQQEIKNQYFTIDAISNNCRGADGKIDLTRGYAAIDQICGPNATRAGLADSEKYWDSMIGVETPYGRNGCVYASVTMTAPYFRFAAEHKNETNVGNLFRAAQEEGSGAHVEKYNGQKANKGDIFVYIQKGDDPTDPENLEHVMVSDGMGGTYGNSSSAADYVDDNGNEIRGNGYIVHNNTENVGNLDIAYIIRMDDRTDAEGQVSAFDPEKREKLRRMLKAQYDSENALSKQAESAEYDQLLSDMKNCPDYAAAYDMAINSGQPMDKINRAVNVAKSYFGVRSGGAQRSNSAVADGDPAVDWKALGKAQNLARVMDVKLAGGKNPTADEWIKMKDAADLIVDSGMLTEEQVAELSDVYGIMGMVADYIDEGHSVPETYDWLLNAGASPTVAFIAISNLNRNYRAIGAAVPLNDGEEVEEGGAGGGY